MQEVGDNYEAVFNEYIEQIADSYIENVSKAGTLVNQGTNSQVEMKAFKQAYENLTDETLEFEYDTILRAWTFNATKLRGFVEKAANRIFGEAASPEKSEWIEDQIDAMTVDTLDFSSYFSGS